MDKDWRTRAEGFKTDWASIMDEPKHKPRKYLIHLICFSGRRPISDLKNRYGMNAVSCERIQSQSAITFSRNRIF